MSLSSLRSVSLILVDQKLQEDFTWKGILSHGAATEKDLLILMHHYISD